ncbi:MAG: hypothetical protein ACK4UP_09580 [Spirosomataceae bacterium]
MKKVFSTLFVVLAAVFCSYAQSVSAPERISYQADVRNALVLNQSVFIKIGILQSSATGTRVN